MQRWLLATALLTGCTEYNVKGDSDPPGGGDSDRDSATDDTAPVSDGVCEALEDPGPAAVALNESCEVPLSTGSFTPVVEWSYGSQSFCGPPAVARIVDTNRSGAVDGDDTPIVVIHELGDVVALYGNSGAVAWRAIGSYGQDGGLAIGDLDGDGWPEVITVSLTQVCALEGADGSERWCSEDLSGHLDPLGYTYPAIADMDGSGEPVITAGNAILSADGAVLGLGSLGLGAAPYGGTGEEGSYGALSVPIDLDGDSQLELVTGNAAYSRDGAVLWSNDGLDGLIAVADFDGDGQGEVVKTSGVTITGMNAKGEEVWGPKRYAGNLGPPAIDDLDGDGTPEIVFAAKSALLAIEWGGTEIWRASISDVSGAAGAVLFDFERDGYPEVLYADETSIRFFSGLDGQVKYSSTAHASYTILETPVVVDVDGDDQVEIVLAHCSGDADIGTITVYGDADHSWPPGRAIWNQHAYWITNVGERGEIPSPTPSNWPAYNSFRSGDVGQPPGEFEDLAAVILDVCEEECDEDRVFVTARLDNRGTEDVPAGVPVSLRAGVGGAILAVQTTSAPIAAGSTGALLRFEVSASALGDARPVVTADEDALGLGGLYECEESNNVEAWSGPVCR